MSVHFAIFMVLFISSSCNPQKQPARFTLEAESLAKKDTIVPQKVTYEYDTDYIMGKFDPSKHVDFTIIPAKYRDAEVRYIRKDVLDGFIKMYNDARKDGVILVIRSATRNFENQKRIWESKWTGKTILEDGTNAAKDIKNNVDRARKILEYSSMPGTSRHHWGTDVDFNNFDNSWFEHGEGQKLYQWMVANAHKYGFCQTYTSMGSDRSTGYSEEKWHWTYMPISSEITKQAKMKITNEMIAGFLGAETAVNIDVLNNYILGISPSCISNKN